MNKNIYTKKDQEQFNIDELDAAAKHYAYIDWSSDEDIFAYELKKYDAFIAGAKWYAEHASLPDESDILRVGIKEGKEQMMKDAIDAEISAKFPVIGRSLISVIDTLKDFKYGDKVRIIIIKED